MDLEDHGLQNKWCKIMLFGGFFKVQTHNVEIPYFHSFQGPPMESLWRSNTFKSRY